jgi:hypothetical protein
LSQYTTTDTSLAAYLITKSYIPKSIDYNQERFLFAFENSNGRNLESLANDYITSNALVDPLTYNRVYRRLLRIIRNRSQWGDE